MKAKQPKRPPGTGSIIRDPKTNGLAIRWPEYEVGKDDGKPRRKYRYEFLGDVSERTANRTLSDRIAESNRTGVLGDKEDPLFSEHVERWERDILSQYEKHSSRIGYAGILRKHLVPRFGKWRISAIGTKEVQEYLSGLRKPDGQPYAPHSIHDYYKVFSAVMKEAVDWYDLSKNPVRGIRLPKLKPVREKWTLTPEQSAALIRSIPNLKARAMVGLAIVGGMRRGELLALRWKSVDDEKCEIDVREASYCGVLDTPKTAKGIRKSDVNSWAFGLLRQWREVSKRVGPEDFVFATRAGTLEQPNNILRRHVYPACDRLQLRRANWLTFRRTYQSWAHNKGIAARTIADLVGHENVDTQFIYVQSMDGAKKEAARKIGEELHRLCPDNSDQPSLFDPEEAWVN